MCKPLGKRPARTITQSYAPLPVEPETGTTSLMLIRRPDSSECPAVQTLVQTVVDEMYGGLWAQPPLDIGEQDWSRSWVVVIEDEIVGVALTSDEWLDDLWIERRHRGQGIGSSLLLQAESEIANRGFRSARLRVVVSNVAAIVFYRRSGWQAEREYTHESLPVFMLEMSKRMNLPDVLR